METVKQADPGKRSGKAVSPVVAPDNNQVYCPPVLKDLGTLKSQTLAGTGTAGGDVDSGGT